MVCRGGELVRPAVRVLDKVHDTSDDEEPSDDEKNVGEGSFRHFWHADGLSEETQHDGRKLFDTLKISTFTYFKNYGNYKS